MSLFPPFKRTHSASLPPPQSPSFTMALPASDAIISTTKYSSPEAYGVYNGVEVDVYMTAQLTAAKEGAREAADEFYNPIEEVYNDIPPDFPFEFEFLPVEKPRLYVERESLQKEKQISVDPISLKGPSMRKSSFNLMLLPPPLIPPTKSKFLSFSLPNSANSSPRFSSTLLKKKLRIESKANPPKASNLARQHSAAEHGHPARKPEVYLQRSKSCSEGRARASSDDLDLWLTAPNVSEYDNRYYYDSFSNTEGTKDNQNKTTRSKDAGDEEFKCGALCLFLPGFGKGKPVRARKEEAEGEKVMSRKEEPVGEKEMSRTVSLEKFECGSWASSAITHDNEDDSKNLYFDLPLELIRTSVNDAHSPVRAAFFFDNDQKGILKNSSTKATAKKCDESPRHVRFSTSSPVSYPASPASCITPRLRKAREDFNAFLEAQGD
ncbi:uncharacterized protein LOC133869634 [Alnus glutinosa]|uniref:uncharacterized protein LOC133869634 n=1 Tax=Alnus glutinosa TaxID=3517 RepID=UPI002D765393|nr:uncharacterized protein LOC133869634 [Alnus glutinosa]